MIEYVYATYGEDHTAMVCNVVTFRARSTIRDVGKVVGFPPDVVDQMAKAMDYHSGMPLEDQLTAIWQEEGRDWKEKTGRGKLEEENPLSIVHSPSSILHSPFSSFLQLVHEIQGVPRHLSIHNGGMVVTACPLIDVVPVERATMPGRVVVQWNKDSVEDAGLIKIDLLGLRTLSLVHEAVGLIREHAGVEVDVQNLPLDDMRVYDLLCDADTIGAFQVESRAQAQLLPRLRPRRFEDVVVATAIIRPGPIQGNMVHPYLRRRAGEEPVTYLHPALEGPLAETLGVMLYQEQVLKVAMAVAGFSAGQADALRRAMRRPELVEGGRARSTAALEALRPRFVSGAVEQGVDAGVAEQIFDQIAGYAGYGFCKSHAASFALLAYATCWLKVYYPAMFYCALLNQQPMGFYPVEVVVNDAKRHNVPILRPDVNRSQTTCTLEPAAPRESRVATHHSQFTIHNSQFTIRNSSRFSLCQGRRGGRRGAHRDRTKSGCLRRPARLLPAGAAA